LLADFKILSAMNRVNVRVRPRIPGNNAPGLTGWYSPSSLARSGWISTTRVFSLPLVVDFLKVKVPPLISVVSCAKASDTRQPVNKQMPNIARSRSVSNPSVNSSRNSSTVKIEPCPFPATRIGLILPGASDYTKESFRGIATLKHCFFVV
jgi:hypothetical protein